MGPGPGETRMSPSRLLAVAFIFVCTCIAWLFPASSVHHRSGEANQHLAEEVTRSGEDPTSSFPPDLGPNDPPEVKTVEEKKEDGPTTTRKEVRMSLGVADRPQSSRVEMRSTSTPGKGPLWYDTWAGDYLRATPSTTPTTCPGEWASGWPFRRPRPSTTGSRSPLPARKAAPTICRAPSW